MTSHAAGRFVGPRRSLPMLPADDVERIHEASLDVLADVGVMFHSQPALDVLEAHGATVDRETTVARIPAAAVDEALRTLPAHFTLGGRTPEFDLPLDGEYVYLACDGWQAAGSPRLEDKARAVADGILATSVPEFPVELERAFTAIIAAAESSRF